jgi:hypothetical protein
MGISKSNVFGSVTEPGAQTKKRTAEHPEMGERRCVFAARVETLLLTSQAAFALDSDDSIGR